ncbi:MAG: rhomboid-like protein [Actinomycetes bacterium]
MRRLRAPATVVYALVLVGTTLAQLLVASTTRHRLLTGSSTDVVHLARDPLLVVLASAFWLPDVTSVVLAPLVFLVLGLGERRFGTARMVMTFAVGHLAATLLTEGTVAVGVYAGWLTTSHEHRLDVGPSYGVCAVLGLLVASLPAARRNAGYVVLTVLLGVPLIVDSELTTIGHVLAAAVGVALWWVPWFRRARPGRAARRVPCRRDYSSASRC